MKLNKTHKETIVSKVVALKFPDTKVTEIESKIGELISKRIQENIITGWDNYAQYITQSSFCYIRYSERNNRYGKYKISVQNYPLLGNGTSLCFYSDMYIDDKEYSKILDKDTENLFSSIFKFKQEKENFELELNGALSSINTDKQLKEYLPELVKYLPLDKQCGLVPISTFDNINKQLKGL